MEYGENFICVPALLQEFCVWNQDPTLVLSFLTQSPASGEWCFSSFHVLYGKEICRVGPFGCPRLGRVQYTPGTCFGRDLNTWRTSLLTLIPLRLEGEGVGARSRRCKRKMAPVSFQEVAVGVLSQNTLPPTWWPLVLLLIYCKEQSLLPLPTWDSSSLLLPFLLSSTRFGS